jgi:hypothetical protein
MKKMPHLKPVGRQSTNWIVRFVLMVATDVFTSSCAGQDVRHIRELQASGQGQVAWQLATDPMTATMARRPSTISAASFTAGTLEMAAIGTAANFRPADEEADARGGVDRHEDDEGEEGGEGDGGEEHDEGSPPPMVKPRPLRRSLLPPAVEEASAGGMALHCLHAELDQGLRRHLLSHRAPPGPEEVGGVVGGVEEDGGEGETVVVDAPGA